MNSFAMNCGSWSLNFILLLTFYWKTCSATIKKKKVTVFNLLCTKKKASEGICVALGERTKNKRRWKEPTDNVIDVPTQHPYTLRGLVHPLSVRAGWTQQNHRWSCVNNHCVPAHPYVACFGPIHWHCSLDADVSNHDNCWSLITKFERSDNQTQGAYNENLGSSWVSESRNSHDSSELS
jgi:hypothetical protein